MSGEEPNSINLKNKSYHIFNQDYSREKYTEKIKELGISSIKNVDALRNQAVNFWLKFPNKFMHGRHNSNVLGDYINNSKRIICIILDTNIFNNSSVPGSIKIFNDVMN